MSKPLKVLSTTALASVFAVSALVPTAVVEAAEPQETVAAKTIENVIFKTKDGQLASISLDHYMKAHSAIITEGPAYIKGDNDVYYELDDYMKAFSAGKTLEKTLEILHSNNKAINIDKDTVVEGDISDKEVVAKDEQPSEDAVQVESVKAINESTIEVTFGEDAEVTEEELAKHDLTLTAGDKELTAKFVSLDGKVAIYDLVEGEELVDATEYTVTGDNIEAKTFQAQFGEEKVASFEFVTSGLNADKEDTTGDFSHELTYKVLNQYGEEMEVENKVFTAVVKKGNFPMTAEAKGNTLTISEKLVAGDVLTITVQDKDKDGKVVAEGTTTITVDEYAEKVATSVSKIVPAADEDKEKLADLKAGDDFTLKAEVLDQNNNVMNEELVRWVSSDKDVVAVMQAKQSEENELEEVNFTDGANATFKAKKEGKATITAFTKDGKASKTFEVTVGQGKLATIDASQATTAVTNKDSVTVYVNEAPETEEGAKVVEFQNENKNNIPVKAADINVDVTTAEKDFDAKDVTVEKVSDKDGNLVAFKITSNRTAQTAEEQKGNYDKGVAYNVKLSTADEKVAAANFDVTSKIDSKVTAIETNKAVEYRNGANPTEAITFKNAKGEVINVLAKDLKFVGLKGNVTKQATDKDGKFVEAQDTDVVTGLKYKLEADTKVVVAVGTTTQAIDVKVTGAAELKTINLGGNITKGVIAGEEDFIQPITLKDQDGNAFIPANLNEYKVAYSGSEENQANFVLAYYNTDKDGKLVVAPEVTADNAEGVALVANTSGDGALAQLTEDKTFTGVQVTAGTGDKAVKSNKISIKVGAVATLTTVDASASATQVTVGGKTTLTVVPKDQYGNVMTINPTTNITVTAGDGEKAFGESINATFQEKKDEEGKLVGYTAELKANAEGTANLTVKVNDVDAKPIAINVKEASDAIQSLEIEEVKTVNNSEDEAKAELKAIAKDAAGKEVAVAEEDLVWSVTKVLDEDGKEILLTAEVEENGDKVYKDANATDENEFLVKIAKDGTLTAQKGLTIKVTAKVESHNDTEATVDVQFDKTPSMFVSGLTANVTEDGELKELDLTKPLEVDATEGVTVTFTATDQYGDDNFEVPTDLATILVAHGTVATATATAGEEGGVTIKAAEQAEVGATTTVTVKYGGETVKIDVIVKEAATPEEPETP